MHHDMGYYECRPWHDSGFFVSYFLYVLKVFKYLEVMLEHFQFADLRDLFAKAKRRKIWRSVGWHRCALRQNGSLPNERWPT